MHNNGWLGTELARDQDQVVVAKTKHAALLFSFLKIQGLTYIIGNFFQKNLSVFFLEWKLKKKNVKKELNALTPIVLVQQSRHFPSQMPLSPF